MRPIEAPKCAHLLEQIELELKRLHRWGDAPPAPDKFIAMGAFGANKMAYEQWLQFVFIPAVKEALAGQRAAPARSEAGIYAVKYFDGSDADTLVRLLNEFDKTYDQEVTHKPTSTGKKQVFISFDVDNDADAKTLLAGKANLKDSPFDVKDASRKEHLTGDWKETVDRRMDNIDIVVVLCGTKTHLANGVANELQIARDKKKVYFLLAAYKDKTCTKPNTALASDKMYSWVWNDLKALIYMPSYFKAKEGTA
jgi:uncharacterized protein YqcC (DUF446 family)